MTKALCPSTPRLRTITTAVFLLLGSTFMGCASASDEATASESYDEASLSADEGEEGTPTADDGPGLPGDDVDGFEAEADNDDLDLSDPSDVLDGDEGDIGEVKTAGESVGTTSAALSKPLLKWGLHPRASDALRRVKVSRGRIMQTIGSARASAGTHGRDGYSHGKPYSAAVDISVRGLGTTSIHRLLSRLRSAGFAAWYRRPGHDGWPYGQIAHIHAVYSAVKMKASLRAQTRDFLNDRTGLVGHHIYKFQRPSAAQKRVVRRLFNAYN
ncbi:MAG: hypothetical protein JWM74_971 [Myxococcaceae bacterium]|nr:hypothetical protein [Myxococcaceae bacterium]